MEDALAQLPQVDLAQRYIQYGFAGFSLILVALIYYLLRQQASERKDLQVAYKENTQVVARFQAGQETIVDRHQNGQERILQAFESGQAKICDHIETATGVLKEVRDHQVNENPRGGGGSR